MLTCVRPLVRLFTCRGPVWEFAERVQFNFARSRRVSMIWFSRSRLFDRSAILSVRPSHTLAARSTSGLSLYDRRSISSAFRHQCPHDARRLVGQGDDHQHGRLALKHPLQSHGSPVAPFAHCPAHEALAPMINSRRRVRSPMLGCLAEFLLSACGTLQRREAEPGREVAASLKRCGRRSQAQQEPSR